MAACKLLGEMRIPRGLNYGEVLHPSISSFPEAFTKCWRVWCCGLGVVQESWQKIIRRIPDFEQVGPPKTGSRAGGTREIPQYTALRTENLLEIKMLRETVKQRFKMTGSTQISGSSEEKILQVSLLLFSVWPCETPWTGLPCPSPSL